MMRPVPKPVPVPPKKASSVMSVCWVPRRSVMRIRSLTISTTSETPTAT